MVRHIVLFWLKDNSPENISIARDKLRSLAGKIEGLLSVEVEPDALRSDRSCDLCLNMVFESQEALDAYRTHPEHIPVQKHMHAVRRSSAAADYPMPEPTRRMPALYASYGPSCQLRHTLDGLFNAGMTGMQLSLAHTTITDLMPFIETFRASAQHAGIQPDLLISPADHTAIPACLPRLGVTHVSVPLPQGKRDLAAIRSAIGSDIRLIAKLQTPADYAFLPTILSASDGLMIVRSTLSRDAARYSLPLLQKRAAQASQAAGKPFIVCCELLTSMREKPAPTASEIMDVYQAVCQGASGLLLNCETSIGKYPMLAMEALRRAALESLQDI